MESTALRDLKAAAHKVQNAPALNKIAAAEELAGALARWCERTEERVRELESKPCP